MTTAAFALQKAIHSTLVADADVVARLGGARVYDDVPRGAALPYVTFGPTTKRDWSAGDDPGNEHIMTLHVWSNAAGRKETQEIIGAMRDALHDQSLALAGYRLINLRHEFSDTRREPDGDGYRGIVRFRAVTEPLT
jgi:hypothetical protein